MQTRVCTREMIVGGHREGNHLHTKEKGLRGNQPCPDLDLSALQPPGRQENKFLLFKLPSLWYCVAATQAD